MSWKNQIRFAPEGDTGAGTVTPPADAISVSKAEFEKYKSDAARATELEKANTALKEDWGHAEALLKRTGDPEMTEKSMRHVLKKAGYGDDEIAEYVEAQREAKKGGDHQDDDDEEPQPKARKKSAAKKGGDNGDDGGDQTDERFSSLQNQLNRQEHHRLSGLFESAVSGTLDTHKDVAKLVEDLVNINTGEDSKSDEVEKYKAGLLESLKEEIEGLTKKGLTQRRAEAIRLTGNESAWSDAWIREEAGKAAVAATGKLRKMFGDVNRLGRSPTGGGAEHFILKQKPVEEPKHRRGAQFSDVQAQARAWGTDQLLRIAAEADTDGKSRT